MRSESASISPHTSTRIADHVLSARAFFIAPSLSLLARASAFAVPMTSFVDRDVVKAAASAEQGGDPSLSVLRAGGRGSGKSTLCRSVASVVLNKRFVTVPLGVTDERVLGSVDVEASAKTAATAATKPGLLGPRGERLAPCSSTTSISWMNTR